MKVKTATESLGDRLRLRSAVFKLEGYDLVPFIAFVGLETLIEPVRSTKGPSTAISRCR
jgi:hypothetical protein